MRTTTAAYQPYFTYVPVGKTVYCNAGRIFDRSNESDIDITDDTDMVFNCLMPFGKKHLNDVFTLDGVQRVSARDAICVRLFQIC